MKKTSKKLEVKIVVVLLVAIAFLLGTAFTKVVTVYAPLNNEAKNADYDFSDKSKYTVVEPQIDGTVLSLSSSCYTLSFGITEDQAFSIFRGMQKIIETRPLTHDTIEDVFEGFNIDIRSARIDDKRDGIYTARLLLVQGQKVLDIDVRPSDAVGMAVRTGISMYVRTDILESDGINRC